MENTSTSGLEQNLWPLSSPVVGVTEEGEPGIRVRIIVRHGVPGRPKEQGTVGKERDDDHGLESAAPVMRSDLLKRAQHRFCSMGNFGEAYERARMHVREWI